MRIVSSGAAVYDSLEFPFYRAERYHQYHKNVVVNRDLPDSYLSSARQAAIESGSIDETCQDGILESNIELAPCETGHTKLPSAAHGETEPSEHEEQTTDADVARNEVAYQFDIWVWSDFACCRERVL